MKGNTKVILAIVAILTMCLACCSGGLFLINLGESEISKDIAEQLREKTAVRKYLGEITKIEADWSESLAEPDASSASTSMVYDVEGTLGAGVMRVQYHLDSGSSAIVDDAVLVLSSGEEISIPLEER